MGRDVPTVGWPLGACRPATLLVTVLAHAVLSRKVQYGLV